MEEGAKDFGRGSWGRRRGAERRAARRWRDEKEKEGGALSGVDFFRRLLEFQSERAAKSTQGERNTKPRPLGEVAALADGEEKKGDGRKKR